MITRPLWTNNGWLWLKHLSFGCLPPPPLPSPPLPSPPLPSPPLPSPPLPSPPLPSPPLPSPPCKQPDWGVSLGASAAPVEGACFHGNKPSFTQCFHCAAPPAKTCTGTSNVQQQHCYTVTLPHCAATVQRDWRNDPRSSTTTTKHPFV